MLDQGRFAAEVAGEHSPDLAEADVRLIDEQEAVFGEEVEQGVGRFAWRPARQVAAVVFHAGAVTDLQQHLDIITGPGRQPLGFEELAVFLELVEAFVELAGDRLDGPLDPVFGQDEVLGRINDHLPLLLQDRARGGVDHRQGFDLVAKKFDPVADFLVGWPKLDDVAPDPELASGELDVVAVVLDVDEPEEHLVAVDGLAELEADHHLPVVVG